MYKLPGAIESWQHQCAAIKTEQSGVATKKKRPREKMPTPPASTTSAYAPSGPPPRSSFSNSSSSSTSVEQASTRDSPPKRRKLHETTDFDLDLTPRAPQPIPSVFRRLSLLAESHDDDDPFVRRPDQSSNNSPSRSSARSGPAVEPSLRTTSSRSTRRSASPVKTVQSLNRLEKPVGYSILDDNATQLPVDVGSLYERIYNISQYGDDIYPVELEHRITQALRGRRPRRNELAPPTSTNACASTGVPHQEGGDADADADAAAELQALQEIAADSRECERIGRSEAAWNALVHWPLLRLALCPGRYRHITAELATTAAIVPKFSPRWGLVLDSAATNATTASKMIDFVLVLDLTGSAKPKQSEEAQRDDAEEVALLRLRSAIASKVGSLMPEDAIVNQTRYSPLTESPIAVSIETKSTAASVDEGKVQLAVWTAAWHKRMRMLGWTGTIVTLPLLLTVGHDWKLFFACDRGTNIEILGELNIGDTSTIQGLYKLLAVIRALAEWISDTYKSWIESVFLEPLPSGKLADNPAILSNG